LYASCYEQSSEAAKEKIESSCLKVVEGFLPKASVHQILRLYKLCFCIPAVASVLEESSHLQAKDLMTFISQLPTPEKRQYLAACTARIPKMPFMKAKDLVRHLPSLGMKQGDLENYLISLYKQDERFIRVIQSDFPHLIEPICNRLRASSELVSYHRFILALRSYGHVQTLARGWQAFVNDFEIMGKTLNKSLVVDLCRQYLPSVSQEELSRFAITCATLKSSTELSISLFHLVVNENFSVNLWKSQPWTAESIQSAWPLMKDKTVQQKKDFVEIAMAILPQTMRYNPIIQQMSLFVSEVSCTVFADKVQEKIVELIKHQNQEEIASYYSFLLSYPEFSSHLSRNASLYTAFLQLSFAYVPLSKKDREGGKRLLRLVELLGEASFDSHVPEEMKSINDAKVKLAFSCLRELKNQNHSFRKIDMNWIVEISLQSLEDPTIKALVQKRGMIHPEFCLAVLGRLIPQLNSHTDTEQTLDLLVDLLDSDCVLSESSLVRLSTYVKEMFSRHESSQALFLCSRRLIAMADYYKNKHVLDELIEEVHIKRLAKALRSGAHDNVLLELTAVSPFLLNPTDIPSIQRMIQGVFQYCLFQMRNNLDLLKLFESAHIASPEMSVFVVDLCHEYMKQPTLQSRPLPIEELTLHLTKASPKAFSMTSFYVKLHELATAFLRQCDSTLYLIPTVTDQMQNVTVSDSCRWQRTIANTSLSLLSKKFIELFLSRNEAEDREKVWQLIRHIHIDRMGVFQHIDSSDLFSDLEAYCLYLENMTPSMLSEALVLSPDGLVGVLNKVMTASVPEAKRFVNRILEIYARHCTRKNENLNTFAMSMGALQIIGTPTLFDLIDPKGKQAIVPLLEFACRCPWGDPDAMLFLKGLEKVTAVSPKSITDDYMIRSLRRVSEHIGAMTSDSDYIIDNATYLIRVVNGVVRSGCNNMRVVRALDEILMQMLVIIKRVLPSSLDLILDQLKAAVPYRDIHSEFAKYYRSHASDATLAILPSKK
jgi:hypothetical protein